MEVHQLEYFCEICRIKSFTKASINLKVAQSCISQQIKKLEKELGIDLFVRTTRNVNLTEAGDIFRLHAERVVNDVNKAKQALLPYTNAGYGKIRIGALPVMSYLGITAIIAKFQLSFPNIHVDLKEEASSILFEDLLSNRLDAVFVTQPNKVPKELKSHTFIEDELVFVCSNTHPLAKETIIDLATTSDQNYIFMKPMNGMYHICLSACHQFGFTPRIIFESSQIDTIIGLTAEGVGVTLLSSKIAKEFQHKPIVIIPMQQKILRNTAFMYRRQSQKNKLISHIEQILAINKQ